jgi:hypothetical protein
VVGGITVKDCEACAECFDETEFTEDDFNEENKLTCSNEECGETLCPCSLCEHVNADSDLRCDEDHFERVERVKDYMRANS